MEWNNRQLSQLAEARRTVEHRRLGDIRADPCDLVSRRSKPDDTVVTVGDARVGDREVVIIAGPTAAVGNDSLWATAAAVHRAGATVFRGRTIAGALSPYLPREVSTDHLRVQRDACRSAGLQLLCEIVDAREISALDEYVDIFEVNQCNMQNFALLKSLGDTRKPVILQRGIFATIEEWLLAAEYLLSRGNASVILCERGIRTFERSTRETLDLGVVPLVRQLTHLPIIVDPCAPTSRRHYVPSVARAAVAAGVDGLLIDVCSDPTPNAPSSSTLSVAELERLIGEVQRIAAAIGRTVAPAPVPDRG